MTATLILHHYQLSPFSQKIRSLLGYYGLDWQSLTTAPMPPRKTLAQLACGYRRVPVAQIGADIFCDSQIIASEVIRLARGDKAVLASEESSDHDYIAELDSERFLTVLAAISPVPLLRNLLNHYSVGDIVRLFGDRVSLARQACLPLPVPGRAARALRNHFADLERRLNAQAFLAGDSPGVVDFSAYHSLWFYCVMSARPLPAGYVALRRWYESIGAFGEGRRREIAGEEAFAMAQASQPRPLPANQISHSLLGQSVSIAPEDYAREPVAGKLVACTASRWIVRVDSDELGLLHLHLPKRGYAIC